jgi:hypothetical protein
MSNTRYYARRAAQQCGRCGRDATGAYCDGCREHYRNKRRVERAADRAGYNLYMRTYKLLGKAS